MNNEQVETTISEECLLRAEAEHARAALQGALLGIKDSLIKTGDPKAWARTHPWVSVGVAAAAGFAAASAIVPASGQRTSDKWSGVINRLKPHQPLAAASAADLPAETRAPTAPPSIWTSVVDSLFELAKVAITNLITTTVQAKSAAVAAHEAVDPSMQDHVPSDVRSDLRND